MSLLLDVPTGVDWLKAKVGAGETVGVTVSCFVVVAW